MSETYELQRQSILRMVGPYLAWTRDCMYDFFCGPHQGLSYGRSCHASCSGSVPKEATVVLRVLISNHERRCSMYIRVSLSLYIYVYIYICIYKCIHARIGMDLVIASDGVMISYDMVGAVRNDIPECDMSVYSMV